MTPLYKAILEADQAGIRPRETAASLGLTNYGIAQIRYRLARMGYTMRDWSSADRQPIAKADMSDGKLPPDVEGPRCKRCHLLLPCDPCPTPENVTAQRKSMLPNSNRMSGPGFDTGAPWSVMNS